MRRQHCNGCRGTNVVPAEAPDSEKATAGLRRSAGEYRARAQRAESRVERLESELSRVTGLCEANEKTRRDIQVTMATERSRVDALVKAALGIVEKHYQHEREMHSRWDGEWYGFSHLYCKDLEDLSATLAPFLADAPTPTDPHCTCAEIQRADPLRHFKGCPRREPLPEGHPARNPEEK